nr:MAG TPA: hypothetical protein [Caudoviricetes sp.]
MLRPFFHLFLSFLELDCMIFLISQNVNTFF